jgi:YcaO-like protein with predicted kinase domain
VRVGAQRGRGLKTRAAKDIVVTASGRLARVKPYKAAAPEDTVLELRARLASLDLAFTEEAICGEEGSFSCCLQLVDDTRCEPVFQTMGKGRTDAYARASAYGEMVERLQNLAFYMMLMYPSEPEIGGPDRYVTFKYYPDEKGLAGEELRRGIAYLSRNDPTPDDFLPAEPAIGVPFWNVFGARNEYLPFRALQVIVGSNGMCSGNTLAEALLHGICEVFERKVLKQLFLSPCSPPDVPLELFASHDIHEDLNRLAKSNGYEVHVKDCSLGLRLPVVGLLIRDGSGRYAFHLGADPSPITALERCLAEMCQGGRIRFKHAGELENTSGDLRVSEFWRTQLHLNIRSYDGHWPPAILQQEPDYPFGGFEHPVSASDEDDLRYVLGIVEDAGWELLLRDNSFLGFPSYHVYIPGISEMTNALDNAFVRQYLAFDRQVHVVTNAANATLAQRAKAVRSMERYAAVAPSRQFLAADYLVHYRQHPLAALPKAALQEFLLQPTRLARTLDLPACFDCASCKFVSRCNYPFISTVWKRLKQAMTSSTWNQNSVRRIAKGGLVSSQPTPVPGESSHCDHARPDAIQ